MLSQIEKSPLIYRTNEFHNHNTDVTLGLACKCQCYNYIDVERDDDGLWLEAYYSVNYDSCFWDDAMKFVFVLPASPK